jgi:hypothetical protein
MGAPSRRAGQAPRRARASDGGTNTAVADQPTSDSEERHDRFTAAQRRSAGFPRDVRNEAHPRGAKVSCRRSTAAASLDRVALLLEVEYMTHRAIVVVAVFWCVATSRTHLGTAHADGDLRKVNHLVLMMQENRSFDNYFGALPYVPGGPYHPCVGKHKRTDHQCVDGLTCQVDSGGNLTCSNYNLNLEGEKIFAFHDRRICAGSGLDHGWPESHREANWAAPGNTYFSSPNDGFVRQNESDNPNQNVDYEIRRSFHRLRPGDLGSGPS